MIHVSENNQTQYKDDAFYDQYYKDFESRDNMFPDSEPECDEY
jgi:hypothetical protein